MFVDEVLWMITFSKASTVKNIFDYFLQGLHGEIYLQKYPGLFAQFDYIGSKHSPFWKQQILILHILIITFQLSLNSIFQITVQENCR